jgi:hypothetical protein
MHEIFLETKYARECAQFNSSNLLSRSTKCLGEEILLLHGIRADGRYEL